jgi:hypothetical protein
MALFDYYTYQTNLAIDKINEEIIFYENCECNNIPMVTDYIEYLKNRIGINKYMKAPIMSTDRLGNKCEIQKMNLDEYSKGLNTITFKRPWNKLKELHKIIKINEFADSLKYKKGTISDEDKQKNIQYIKDEVIDGLKTKKFLKGGSVIEYDDQKMVIISISCVFYNKKKHKYCVDWDE